jgi:dipeptidyl aminopeptidase/acylaminoacyl peptidase
MKKGGDRGDKSLRTNSAFHSTFDITVGSLQKSLYVTIDGNYTFVIIELKGNIYALTIGWYGDYYLISGFSSDGEKLTYSGDKMDTNTNTIVLATGGGGAEKVTDNDLRQQLSNWKQFEYIKSAAPIVAIDLALDAADPNGSGCVVS